MKQINDSIGIISGLFKFLIMKLNLFDNKCEFLVFCLSIY